MIDVSPKSETAKRGYWFLQLRRKIKRNQCSRRRRANLLEDREELGQSRFCWISNEANKQLSSPKLYFPPREFFLWISISWQVKQEARSWSSLQGISLFHLKKNIHRRHLLQTALQHNVSDLKLGLRVCTASAHFSSCPHDYLVIVSPSAWHWSPVSLSSSHHCNAGCRSVPQGWAPREMPPGPSYAHSQLSRP